MSPRHVESFRAGWADDVHASPDQDCRQNLAFRRLGAHSTVAQDRPPPAVGEQCEGPVCRGRARLATGGCGRGPRRRAHVVTDELGGQLRGQTFIEQNTHSFREPRERAPAPQSPDRASRMERKSENPLEVGFRRDVEPPHHRAVCRRASRSSRPITILGAMMFVLGLYFALKERRENRARRAASQDHPK